MANKERIRHSVPALRHDGERGRLDRRGGVSGYHLGKHAVKPENLSVPLWNDIAHARSQAAVVEANRAVWDRAQTIEEDGRLLVEKLKGLIAKTQLDQEVVEALDIAVSDHYALTALDPNHPEQLAAIQATAEMITSEVARIESNLNSQNPNAWYSSIRQTADMITSEVARIEGALNSANPNVWYSSIKQTYDQITSTVAMLDSPANTPGQFTSISQTASRVESVAATLNNGNPWDGHSQFSSITQTANQISLIVSRLDNPDLRDPDHFTIIRQMVDEIDLRVKAGDVISAINVTPGNVRILGSKIQLDGDVDVKGTFKVGEANIEDLSVGTIKIKDSAVTLGKLDALQASGNYLLIITSNENFPPTGPDRIYFAYRTQITTPEFSQFAALPMVRFRIKSGIRRDDQPPGPWNEWWSNWTPWHLVYESFTYYPSTSVRLVPPLSESQSRVFGSSAMFNLGRHSAGGPGVDYEAYALVRDVRSGGFDIVVLVHVNPGPGYPNYDYQVAAEVEWARWGLDA